MGSSFSLFSLHPSNQNCAQAKEGSCLNKYFYANFLWPHASDFILLFVLNGLLFPLQGLVQTIGPSNDVNTPASIA